MQAEMQATPAEAFRLAGTFAAGLGRATAGTGTTQVVLQFDAWELHDIMQLVVVDVSGVESPGVVGAILGVCACSSEPPIQNLSPIRITTRKPYSTKAQSACSLDEPVAKFAPAMRIDAPA